MKPFRSFFLPVAVVGALAAGGWLLRSQGRVARAEVAAEKRGESGPLSLAAAREIQGAVGVLREHLDDVARRGGAPASYEAWVRQQEQARAALVALRRGWADLEPVALAEGAGRPLGETLERGRRLSTKLNQLWFDYNERGSGVTVESARLAVQKLLPVVAGELAPVAVALPGALQDEHARGLAELGAVVVAARRERLAAGAGLLALLGVAGFFGRRGPGSGRGKEQKRETIGQKERPVERVPGAVKVEKVIGSGPLAPVAPTSSLVAHYRESAAAAENGMPKILLVASDEGLRGMLTLLISKVGYTVVDCEGATQALAASEAIRFELALVDEALAGGRGLELWREVRRMGAKVPTIFVTARPGAATVAQLVASGVMEELAKPVDPRELLRKISSALGERGIPFSFTAQPFSPARVVEQPAASATAGAGAEEMLPTTRAPVIELPAENPVAVEALLPLPVPVAAVIAEPSVGETVGAGEIPTSVAPRKKTKRRALATEEEEKA